MVLKPVEQLEKLRVEGRLAARKLEYLDASFAVHHSLDAPLQVLDRHRVHTRSRTHGRIRIAGRTSQIARIDDLNQREAGRKLLLNPEGFARVGIPAKRSRC